MDKVFISGSRSIKELDDVVINNIHDMMENDNTILIGDAAGIDRLVQEHLHNAKYKNVIIFYSGEVCRNNIGGWEARQIHVPENVTGFQFYAEKDKALAKEATYGFMIWNGKSVGTVLNVLRMIMLKKECLLYYCVITNRSSVHFANVSKFADGDDWSEFFNHEFAYMDKKDLYDKASREEKIFMLRQGCIVDLPQEDLKRFCKSDT